MTERRKKAIAISHVDFEDLGSLHPLLQARGFDIRRVDAAVADWVELSGSEADLVVVLGGPLGIADIPAYPFLDNELAFIGRCLDAQVPLIGICLGAQLIASALGARVVPMGVREIGFMPLELTRAGVASPLASIYGAPVLHWHGDEFEIPRGAVNLAKTVIGNHQAFALGTNVLGLQFHLEMDSRYFERWLIGNAGELAQAGIDPRRLRADAQKYGKEMAAAAGVVFGRWLDAAGIFQPE
ncbi:glutamine amidotransferase [Variovorax paradoxus]|uniref:glutamine amidotransferase n=1 Tax=Variovorax paradoxus TaxID=34073 RepID=UPI00193453CA|nr:glutamine amidotransferase [Variovorax paradoxus]